MFFLP